MALHNITASGNQLVIELIVTEGDYAPSLITLKNPSIKLTTDRIKFLDSGVYQTALRFTDINEIGGVAPTDLEEAADLISALIANFSGGGSAPTYKVYTALLTQEGTNAPVATVLENTLGEELVWSYLTEGTYRITASESIFIEDVTFYIINCNNNSINSKNQFIVYRNSDLIVEVQTGVEFLMQDGLLYKTPIEIRVYN
jgi:hypothetical protein